MSFSIDQWAILVAGYFIAAIPFGLVVAKLVAGRDIRKQGSGNIGATNVARTMGKKWGIFVLFLDAMKGYLVVAVATHFGSENFVNLVAVVAVIAHCYPLYLKFKGGKGVATSLGVLLAIAPALVGIAALVFFIVFFATRIVSAASLAAALALPIEAAVMTTHLKLVAALIIAALVWWKHRANIKRLVRGQEPKFGTRS